MNASQIVEAVLFASDAPLTADEIARADSQLDEDVVEEAIQILQAEYDDAQRSFQLVEVAEGFQILTRPEYAPYLERFDNVPRSTRLSGPALETLAIIAYRQPLGRLEIEYIRGVGASGVVRTLQERHLIDVVGRGEGLGRPLLYGTTPHFLEHFGFRSLEDLPRPEELPIILRDRVPLDPDGEEGEGAGEGEDAQETLQLGEGEGGAEAAGDGHGSEDDGSEGAEGGEGEPGTDDSDADLADDADADGPDAADDADEAESDGSEAEADGPEGAEPPAEPEAPLEEDDDSRRDGSE